MRTRGVWSRTAHTISLTRLVAGLVFATIAFQPVPRAIPVSLYVAAMLSDLIDGQVARRGNVASYFGRVLDLISDKSLTIVSLLFAAACGIAIVPLALIGVREIVMLGARLITVSGRQILPTNRTFGGIMAAVLWSDTLVLLLGRKLLAVRHGVEQIYWACSLILMVNMAARLWWSAKRIRAFVEDETE